MSGPPCVLGLERARVASFIPRPSDEHRLPVSRGSPDLTFPGRLLSAEMFSPACGKHCTLSVVLRPLGSLGVDRASRGECELTLALSSSPVT